MDLNGIFSKFYKQRKFLAHPQSLSPILRFANSYIIAILILLLALEPISEITIFALSAFISIQYFQRSQRIDHALFQSIFIIHFPEKVLRSVKLRIFIIQPSSILIFLNLALTIILGEFQLNFIWAILVYFLSILKIYLPLITKLKMPPFFEVILYLLLLFGIKTHDSLVFYIIFIVSFVLFIFSYLDFHWVFKRPPKNYHPALKMYIKSMTIPILVFSAYLALLFQNSSLFFLGWSMSFIVFSIEINRVCCIVARSPSIKELVTIVKKPILVHAGFLLVFLFVSTNIK